MTEAVTEPVTEASAASALTAAEVSVDSVRRVTAWSFARDKDGKDRPRKLLLDADPTDPVI